MKKFIVALKHKSQEEVIGEFIFGEPDGFSGCRMDRQWFDSREAAEAEILRRDSLKIAVFEINVSAVKLD